MLTYNVCELNTQTEVYLFKYKVAWTAFKYQTHMEDKEHNFPVRVADHGGQQMIYFKHFRHSSTTISTQWCQFVCVTFKKFNPAIFELG